MLASFSFSLVSLLCIHFLRNPLFESRNTLIIRMSLVVLCFIMAVIVMVLEPQYPVIGSTYLCGAEGAFLFCLYSCLLILCSFTSKKTLQEVVSLNVKSDLESSLSIYNSMTLPATFLYTIKIAFGSYSLDVFMLGNPLEW